VSAQATWWLAPAWCVSRVGKALLILVALALLYWLSESGMLSKLVAICKTFAEMAHEHWWAMAALFVVNAMLEASLVLSTVPHVCHVLLPLSFGFAGGAAMIFGLAFSGTSANFTCGCFNRFYSRGGAVIGSITCFVCGRFIVRDCVLASIGHFKLYRACDRAMQNDPTLVILIRLSPLSDAIISYVLALTGVPLKLQG